MSDIQCGVDEAGRGPVIGPMVIAGVSAPLSALLEIGVRDSKKLTPARRRAMRAQIESVAEKIVVKVLQPWEIDGMRERMTMNEIEVVVFAEVVDELGCEEVYVDSADTVEERFGREIEALLSRKVRVVAEHRADERYPAVSAASIIAKLVRDELIEGIKREIGDFGSGYPADPRTVEFLRRYCREHGELPRYVRRSWETAKRILGTQGQRSLDEF
jgi:ribonuclease HII